MKISNSEEFRRVEKKKNQDEPLSRKAQFKGLSSPSVGGRSIPPKKRGETSYKGKRVKRLLRGDEIQGVGGKEKGSSLGKTLRPDPSWETSGNRPGDGLKQSSLWKYGLMILGGSIKESSRKKGAKRGCRQNGKFVYCQGVLRGG